MVKIGEAKNKLSKKRTLNEIGGKFLNSGEIGGNIQ